MVAYISWGTGLGNVSSCLCMVIRASEGRSWGRRLEEMDLGGKRACWILLPSFQTALLPSSPQQNSSYGTEEIHYQATYQEESKHVLYLPLVGNLIVALCSPPPNSMQCALQQCGCILCILWRGRTGLLVYALKH